MAASADHVKALVRSHGRGDDDSFYSVALQVAAKAARKGHHRFASDLKGIVEAARREAQATIVTPIAQPRGELADLVIASFPKIALRDLVAAEDLKDSIRQVITEQRQRHELAKRGFDPVYRLLLAGPPGTGKTMTASILARELDLPLLTIRLDSVMSKYMGETAAKLRLLFDASADRRAVYLFDEFDALGGNRDGNDVGEARRILNSFLLFLESTGPESVLVAATNHRTILDRALFRRFDLVLTYCLPTPDEAVRVMDQRLGPLGQIVSWNIVREHCGELSQAELVKAAEAAAKRSLLAGEQRVATETLVVALRERDKSTVVR